jgi:hypothetical protein
MENKETIEELKKLNSSITELKTIMDYQLRRIATRIEEMNK